MLKKFLFVSIASLFCVLLLFIAAEVLSRCYTSLVSGGTWRDFLSANGVAYGLLPFTQYDSELGWVPVADYKTYFYSKDENNRDSTTRYSTKSFGFRKFGDLKSDKKRVLIVGDSFTHAINIDDDKTYYSLLGDEYEVFAVGASGYGAYQEYLIVKKYLDLIKPDVIVVQFCGNDVSDAHLPLEKLSLYNNQRQVRPYVSPQGVPYFGIPARNYFENQLLRGNSALYYSRALTLLYASLSDLSLNSMKLTNNYFEAKESNRSVDQKIVEDAYRCLFKSYEALLHSSGAKVVLLPTGVNRNVAAFCEDNAIDIVKEHLDEFELEETRGKRTVGPDGNHWNILGHEIVGRALKHTLDAYFANAPSP